MKIAYRQLRRIIKEEIEMISSTFNEGIWDFIKKKTEPREHWKDATGMSHRDMLGPQTTSLEDASYDLAKALINNIESTRMWMGPDSVGMMADYDRKGWLQIADAKERGIWETILHTVHEGVSQMSQQVLDDWKNSGYITREEPQVLLSYGLGPARGIWLRWYGYQELKRAVSRGDEYGL